MLDSGTGTRALSVRHENIDDKTDGVGDEQAEAAVWSPGWAARGSDPCTGGAVRRSLG